MKKYEVLLAAVAVFCLLALPIFGGGEKEKAAAVERKIVFQTFFGAGQEETENGFMSQAVREAFPNWEFHIQWFTYAAYAEKLNLQIASGDLPDMTVADTNIQLPRMVDEDQVIALDDLLNQYGKNLLKYTPSWHWDACTYDGKKMCIINGWTTKIWGPYIRKDWLDNLGLGMPDTLDDYEKVIRAFTFEDPDRNGKDDTFGFGFREGVNWADWIFHPFGVAPGHHHTGIWRKRAGRVEIDWVQPGMLDALKFIRKLYQGGMIIPESITFSGTDWGQAFVTGRFGIHYHAAGTLQSHYFALKEKFPEAELASLDPPKGPGGRGSSDEPMHWGFVISKKCQYPEEYMKLMDWFAGDGWDKMHGWVNSVSAKVGRGFKEYNDKGWTVYWSKEEMTTKAVQDGLTQDNNETFYHWKRPIDKFHASLPADEAAFYQKKDREVKFIPEYYKHLENAQKYDVTSLKAKPAPSEGQYWGSLRTKYKETMSKIVATEGIDVDAVWEEWLEYWRANGGDQITKEVNEMLK